MEYKMINPPKECAIKSNAVALTNEAYEALLDAHHMAGGVKNKQDGLSLKAFASELLLEAISNIEWDTSDMNIILGGNR